MERSNLSSTDPLLKDGLGPDHGMHWSSVSLVASGRSDSPYGPSRKPASEPDRNVQSARQAAPEQW